MGLDECWELKRNVEFGAAFFFISIIMDALVFSLLFIFIWFSWQPNGAFVERNNRLSTLHCSSG